MSEPHRIVSLTHLMRNRFFLEYSSQIAQLPKWTEGPNSAEVNPEALLLAKQYVRIIEIDSSLRWMKLCLSVFLETYLTVVGISRKPIVNFEKAWPTFRDKVSPEAVEFFEKFSQCAYMQRAKAKYSVLLKDLPAVEVEYAEARDLCKGMARHVSQLRLAALRHSRGASTVQDSPMRDSTDDIDLL